MKLYSFQEHFVELKTRILSVFACLLITTLFGYYFSDNIFELLLSPLELLLDKTHRIIYTGLTEAFVTYLRLSIYTGIFLTMPYLALQIYLFLSPGLYPHEKKLVATLLAFSPVLFYAGGFFVFSIVMPQAWKFFLGFENYAGQVPIIFEAKISEYLSLVTQLIIAFGFAFQLPIFMVICNLLGIITTNSLKNKRRLAIVAIFIIAAIFTPPDVLSQFALALPLMLLYEISILLCKTLENRGRLNVRHKMD